MSTSDSLPNPKILPHLSNNQFIFFNADYCPFGQRGWMTLLEKKVDFKYVEVNCFNKTLENTKLFLEVSPNGTVPAGIYHGKNIYESVPFCKYVDEMFPANNLCTNTPYHRWEALTLLNDASENFVPTFYKVLCENDSEASKEHRAKMKDILKNFNQQLERSGGPWFMGKQFTLVDISLLSFFERMVVLFPYYRDWDPFQNAELQELTRWMDAGFARESFKITSADRSEQSMIVQPFKSRRRADYLREVYQAYVLNKVPEMKSMLAKSFGPDSAISFKGIPKSATEIAQTSTHEPQINAV